MKVSTPRYTLCLFLQLTFMFCDVIFNCMCLFPRSRDALLVIFIFQDLFLVFSITTMLMTFFSTYLFQAGLVEVVAARFLWAGCASATYLCCSVALHAAWLLHRWGGADLVSTPLLVLLFVLHRCMSPWYYYWWKRAALRVGDARLHDDLHWLGRHLHTRSP